MNARLLTITSAMIILLMTLAISTSQASQQGIRWSFTYLDEIHPNAIYPVAFAQRTNDSMIDVIYRGNNGPSHVTDRAGRWITESLTAPGYWGPTAYAFDSAGEAHSAPMEVKRINNIWNVAVTYYAPGKDLEKVYTNDMSLIDETEPPGNKAHVLRLAKSGAVYMSFTTSLGSFFASAPSGGRWSWEQIQRGMGKPPTEIEIDSQGTAHRFQGSTYSRQVDGRWKDESLSGISLESDLTLDSMDQPHIAGLTKSSPVEFQYSAKSGGQWQKASLPRLLTENVGGAYNLSFALLTDDNRQPILVTVEPLFEAGFRVAVWSGGVWNIEVVKPVDTRLQFVQGTYTIRGPFGGGLDLVIVGRSSRTDKTAALYYARAELPGTVPTAGPTAAQPTEAPATNTPEPIPATATDVPSMTPIPTSSPLPATPIASPFPTEMPSPTRTISPTTTLLYLPSLRRDP